MDIGTTIEAKLSEMSTTGLRDPEITNHNAIKAQASKDFNGGCIGRRHGTLAVNISLTIEFFSLLFSLLISRFNLVLMIGRRKYITKNTDPRNKSTPNVLR